MSLVNLDFLVISWSFENGDIGLTISSLDLLGFAKYGVFAGFHQYALKVIILI